MIPDHGPFSPEQKQSLDQILSGLDQGQRLWLGGFLSAGSAASLAAPSSTAPAKKVPLTVLYGTESGNCEALADQTAKAAKKMGFKPAMKNMADLQPADLVKDENVLVIVSTWGDGDAPETAVVFHKAFMEEEHDFSKTKFSVCALGDTSYEQFCEIGKQMDSRLETLGAKRVAERVDCDVDYEESYEGWVATALKELAPEPAAARSPLFLLRLP